MGEYGGIWGIWKSMGGDLRSKEGGGDSGKLWEKWIGGGSKRESD